MGCPSTPTTATSTTVCATLKTFSTSVTKTTVTTTNAGRIQDPTQQVKPALYPPKPSQFSGRAKGNLTVNTKATFGIDKDYSSVEDSNVDGNSNGVCRIPSLTPVSSSHSCMNNMTTATFASSQSNTIIQSSNSSNQPKLPKNNGLTKKTIQKVALDMNKEDNGCKRINHILEGDGDQSGSMNQVTYNVECTNGISGAGNNIQTNKAAPWGGWIPVSIGKESPWKSYIGQPSMYPHQYSARIPYQYGSPSHLQTHHLMTPQSWTSVAWPLILPHSQPHSLSDSSPNYNCNMNQTLLLPHPTYSPSTNHTYVGSQSLRLTPCQPPPQNNYTIEAFQTSHSKSLAAQTGDSRTFPIAKINSKSNTTTGTLTKTTLSNNINSPLSQPSPVVSRESCVSSHPGIGIHQPGYGYANQQNMIIPFYQYSGSMAPYYNWVNPLVMHWPVAQSPSTPLHSTPNNTSTIVAQSKHTESGLPHTALTFTPQNEKNSITTSPQVRTSKFKEVQSLPAHNSVFKSGRGSHTGRVYNRNHHHYYQTFHTQPYYSNIEMVCKQQSEQNKNEQPKTSQSTIPHAFLSAPRISLSPSKFPKPLAQGHCQNNPPQKSFGSSVCGISIVATVEQEEQSTTVPMTPPPTPLPNIEEINDGVANSNAS